MAGWLVRLQSQKDCCGEGEEADFYTEVFGFCILISTKYF
jgi:hypothetical protein